jgi:trehalose synthase
VEQADSYVFSRKEFVWKGLKDGKVWIVPPSIDAFSPKNQHLDEASVAAILFAAGLGEDPDGGAPMFAREDGSPARVDRPAELFEEDHLTRDDILVAQISRWDRLKDPAGLLECFAAHCDDPRVHLLLAGPAVEGVTDDPEGAEVLAEVREQSEDLPQKLKDRVHLACLPMDDVEENAAIVNAIQRRADVVVQKSIAEGFGLTVAEAMWKATPVVASRVGGIQDQIVDGESGILIDDPSDLDAFGAAIRGLVADPARAQQIGTAARERVRSEFLGTRHLLQYLALIAELISEPAR